MCLEFEYDIPSHEHLKLLHYFNNNFFFSILNVKHLSTHPPLLDIVYHCQLPTSRSTIGIQSRTTVYCYTQPCFNLLSLPTAASSYCVYIHPLQECCNWAAELNLSSSGWYAHAFCFFWENSETETPVCNRKTKKIIMDSFFFSFFCGLLFML